MEALIHKLLSFTTYRAVSSSSPAATHEFVTKIPTSTLLIDKSPLDWATSLEMEKGFSQAVEEAVQSDGVLANQVYFCNELLHTNSEERIGMHKINECKFSRKHGLTLDTRYIMWYVNLTPTPQDIENYRSGSHWCVILVDFTRDSTDSTHESLAIGSLHEIFPNVYARVRFFDPMSGGITPNIRREIERLLDNQLRANLLRINKNYARLLPEHPTEEILTLRVNTIDMRWSLQSDGVQCGIWCIWFAHQFMLTGVLDFTAWYRPPRPTKISQNQLAFRSWYFSSYSDDDGPAGKKHMRPAKPPPTEKSKIECIDIDSEEDAPPRKKPSGEKRMQPVKALPIVLDDASTYKKSDGTHPQPARTPKLDGDSSQQPIGIDDSDDDTPK